MRLPRSLRTAAPVLCSVALAGALAAPASASGRPVPDRRAQSLGRAVLPASDGWGSATAGTTGGAAADAAHVSVRIVAEHNCIRLPAGVPTAEVLYNWGGTGLTARENLVDVGPADLVGAFDAANPAAPLGGDAGWTPVLRTRVHPGGRAARPGRPARGRGTAVTSVAARVGHPWVTRR
ncbi:hypothetical protein BX265_0840 [Streptomyces sp. TLI_235]|nr:hypothetical protein [Streptomyces sp. TLI_235]PBC76138.1 hypothetical protein BX265_0840 [Streptomyces sp. TLI_235]